jgi:hypothetical protein
MIFLIVCSFLHLSVAYEDISELVLNISQKREEINELETDVYKYGEYMQALVFPEARCKYRQYEKIVTKIEDLEKMIVPGHYSLYSFQ